MFLHKLATKTVSRRLYSTSSPKSGASLFYYQYGGPLVKCIVLASATTMAYQLLWEHLEYQEYRDESDAYVAKLEERLKTLEQQQQKEL